MQSKAVVKWSSFIGGAVVVAFSAITISLPDTTAVSSTQNIASAEQARLGPGLPIRLTIPKINVDAAILQVGLISGGALDAPKGPADVGWFNLGKRPGEVGSAVIDGHYGWKNGIPAVFDNLSTLHKGDKIFVEDGTGVTITFVVRETRTYDPKADAKDVFNSSDGKEHLNLITCEGVWDAISKSYSNRLVIFADRE